MHACVCRRHRVLGTSSQHFMTLSTHTHTTTTHKTHTHTQKPSFKFHSKARAISTTIIDFFTPNGQRTHSQICFALRNVFQGRQLHPNNSLTKIHKRYANKTFFLIWLIYVCSRFEWRNNLERCRKPAAASVCFKETLFFRLINVLENKFWMPTWQWMIQQQQQQHQQPNKHHANFPNVTNAR